MNSQFFDIDSSGDQLRVSLKDHWVFRNVTALEMASSALMEMADRPVQFRCGGLQDIDIAGAWVLHDRSQQLSEIGIKSEFVGFKAGHFKFLQHIIDVAAIREYAHELDTPKPPHFLRHAMEHLGHFSTSKIDDLGQVARSILDGIRKPSRMMLAETVRQIHETGVKAIPVVVVITFLIGIVLAYQASGQLEQFGAKIFVVDLVSISIMREMGVLLAAVMVAGRSGSAFAAAIGTMKLNEEVDAMRVLGLNPNRILVIPRILGLLVALPALTLFADMAGIAGGALIAVGTLDIGTTQFVERVASSTDLNDLAVGLIKAPFFALLIASVGTLRGMQVKSSAEELGSQTTIAVVQSIFLIIVADAFFTTLFTRLGF